MRSPSGPPNLIVAALVLVAGMLPAVAHAQGLTVETLEHGSWPESVSALQHDLHSEGTVVHVVVTDSTGARAVCGSYDLAFDGPGSEAFQVGPCDPATNATALELVSRAALFQEAEPVPHPRAIRLAATEIRVGESTGGAGVTGGSELHCTVSIRPYLDDLENGGRVYLTPDRYVVRPSAADVSASDGQQSGWLLSSGPRASLTIDYDVVERATGEVVLHDQTELSCASGAASEQPSPPSVSSASAVSDAEAPTPAPSAALTATPPGAQKAEDWGLWILLSVLGGTLVAAAIVGIVAAAQGPGQPAAGSDGSVVMTLVELP